MDETLAELFARHSQSSNFDGNPMSAFRAEIGGNEYGPNETPGTIGLYGGRYTVVVNPGECLTRNLAHSFQQSHSFLLFQGLISTPGRCIIPCWR